MNSTASISPNETLFKTFSVPYKRILTSSIHGLSLDATGKYAALAGKKGLYIVDLDQPTEVSRSLLSNTKWEVSVVEWNPHPSWKGYIASSANQNTLIWNIEDDLPLQSTLQSHSRAVSDISWSYFDPNVLATCSADTYINLWDIRDPKKPNKTNAFCGWTAGATQVKWNRLNKLILASTHNGEVRIWDIRKITSPVSFITAHMAKIYGLDWSFTAENELVTCSEDKQVKIWDINSPRASKGTIQCGAPAFRAKYAPFGGGIVTMAQKSDFTLRLWNLDNMIDPVRVFFRA
jgi:WD40 repeat protein